MVRRGWVGLVEECLSGMWLGFSCGFWNFGGEQYFREGAGDGDEVTDDDEYHVVNGFSHGFGSIGISAASPSSITGA